MDELSDKGTVLAHQVSRQIDRHGLSVEEITDAVVLLLSGLFLQHGTTPENLVRVMGALQTQVLLRVQAQRHKRAGAAAEKVGSEL